LCENFFGRNGDAESLNSIDEDRDPQVRKAWQELVPIGIHVDEMALRARRDACLLIERGNGAGPAGVAAIRGPFSCLGSRRSKREPVCGPVRNQHWLER
jgi:hypothetical protein